VLRVTGEDFLDALSSDAASPALLEGARTRLARTHPAVRPKRALAPQEQTA
jgi:hypothetical protein